MSVSFALCVACSACFVAVCIGCVDVTPIVLDDQSDAQKPDVEGGAPETDSDAASSCISCIEAPNVPGPGCRDQVTACKVDIKCGFTYFCAKENGCFDKPNRTEEISCALPCAEKYGISDRADDPSFVLAFAIDECASKYCMAACSSYRPKER